MPCDLMLAKRLLGVETWYLPSQGGEAKPLPNPIARQRAPAEEIPLETALGHLLGEPSGRGMNID